MIQVQHQAKCQAFLIKGTSVSTVTFTLACLSLAKDAKDSAV